MLTITPDVVAMETIFNQYNKGLLLLTKISMVPLVIFVGICKAWKKDVFSGPSVAHFNVLTSNSFALHEAQGIRRLYKSSRCIKQMFIPNYILEFIFI
jgi:hypothetical protein